MPKEPKVIRTEDRHSETGIILPESARERRPSEDVTAVDVDIGELYKDFVEPSEELRKLLDEGESSPVTDYSMDKVKAIVNLTCSLMDIEVIRKSGITSNQVKAIVEASDMDKARLCLSLLESMQTDFMAVSSAKCHIEDLLILLKG